MIITEKVLMKITNRNRNFYKSLGYEVTEEYCAISIRDLASSSHYEVDVRCAVCSKEKKLIYFKYLKNTELTDIYTCSNKCAMVKNQKTCMDRYGVLHQNQVKENVNKILDTKVKKGLVSYDFDDFKSYRRVVNNFTNKNKKTLFENWDGFDYYDGEFIKEYFKLDSNDRKYPSIDHKISVVYGYNNGIGPEEIASLQNLCLTKRKHNSFKSYLNELDYLEKISN
jgi:hypothetical protein